jgi:hypothetical protein
MKWTRHHAGNWSSNGYEIKRASPRTKWRLLRDGSFWDMIDKLPDAKRACERDFARRPKTETARSEDRAASSSDELDLG